LPVARQRGSTPGGAARSQQPPGRRSPAVVREGSSHKRLRNMTMQRPCLGLWTCFQQVGPGGGLDDRTARWPSGAFGESPGSDRTGARHWRFHRGDAPPADAPPADAPGRDLLAVDAGPELPTFRAPEPIPGVNSDADEKGPFLSADGLRRYFCANRPGGSGGDDIWLASRSSLGVGFG